jgi:hypothetical protein
MKIKKYKKMIIIFCIIFVLLVLSATVFVNRLYYNIISVNDVFLRKDSVSLIDNTLSLTCETSSSAIAFRSYKYHIEDKKLYITIKGGLVSRFSKAGGLIEIFIDDNEVGTVTDIFIRDGEDTKLIYSVEF